MAPIIIWVCSPPSLINWCWFPPGLGEGPYRCPGGPIAPLAVTAGLGASLGVWGGPVPFGVGGSSSLLAPAFARFLLLGLGSSAPAPPGPLAAAAAADTAPRLLGAGLILAAPGAPRLLPAPRPAGAPVVVGGSGWLKLPGLPAPVVAGL